MVNIVLRHFKCSIIIYFMYYFMYQSVLPIGKFVTCMHCQRKPEEGLRYPWTRVAVGCELMCVMRIKPDPL